MKTSHLEMALKEINEAWAKHDDDGVVHLTMAQTSLIAGVLEELILARHEVRPEYQTN